MLYIAFAKATWKHALFMLKLGKLKVENRGGWFFSPKDCMIRCTFHVVKITQMSHLLLLSQGNKKARAYSACQLLL